MKSETELLAGASALLRSTALPAGVAAEVTTVEEQTRSAIWADQKPHLQEAGLTEGVCLRVINKGGHGMITARSAAPSQASELGRRALEMAQVSPADPHRVFGAPAARYPLALPVDTALFTRPLDDILAELSQLEKKILKIDRRIKKAIKLHYREARSGTAIANSHSVSLARMEASVSFAAEVMAEDGGQTEVAWDYQSRRRSGDWSLDEIAEAVARHAAESLGGKPLTSGPYAVLFHPRVGTQLLGLLSNALSAEAVQLGRSFFAGKLHQSVASPLVELIDDPLLPEGVASAPFDDEGTPHQTCTMVKEGVLADFFYDLRSASKEGRASNGHGVKEGLGAVPRPGSTNFYMKPGVARAEDMLASHPHVFHLREVMGLHMADPITGEFSLGASGFLYENGQSVRPVRGVTIAGNLSSVLMDVAAVGNDLTWYGSTGVPSFLLPRVMIAGS